MAVINVNSDYANLVATAQAVGEIGAVLYWDGIVPDSAFEIYASVDGGRSWLVYSEGGLANAPATFGADFPNAVSIPKRLSLM